MAAGTDDLTPREKWNRRYREPGPRPLAAGPSGWLAENRSVLSERPPGRALDVACGRGRNAVFLAQLGFEVDAVDVSDVAIEALAAAAVDLGLGIDARRMDLEREPLPAERYDVIVQFDYLQRDLFGPLARALRPGGCLIVETFTRAHVEELGNSFDPRYLLHRNELLLAFVGLHLLVRHYREGVVERAGRPRALASIIAERHPDQ